MAKARLRAVSRQVFCTGAGDEKGFFKMRNPAKLPFLTGFAFLLVLAGMLAVLASQAPLAESEVIVPKRTIDLFNGKDLSNFYTWLVDYKYDDPKRVFSVVDQVDGAPAIRSSGEVWGGLITRQKYANYRLIAEYRWGLATWGSRKNDARDSGILLHCQEPEGAYSPDFNGAWMRSIEYQIIEGGTGDIILVRGHTPEGEELRPRLTATVRENEQGQFFWDPDGEPRVFTRRHINWFGRDPEWESVLGFRGADDVENPPGLWNRIEIICDGDSLTYLLNGTVVNKGTNSSLTSGKILFQSEGAEIYFRRIELRPL